MAKIQYKVIQAEEPESPSRELLEITEGGRTLITTLKAFGPNTFNRNVAEMQRQYSPTSTFRLGEITTAESVLAALYNFPNRAKLQIFDSNWLQLGRIVRGQDMVYLNPPKDAQGNPITDESHLKTLLNQAEKVNGIWMLPNGKIEGVRDFVGVPYETFQQQKEQSAEDFAQSGLARGLECSRTKTAEKLAEIASKKNYPLVIHVRGFEPCKTPILKVAGLFSDKALDCQRLIVSGDYKGGSNNGYAFGVFSSRKASAPKD